MNTQHFYFFAITCAAFFSSVGASDPTRKQLDFFESKIRPIFVENCYGCHSENAKQSDGSLFLDSRAGLLSGGDSGPAIVPGDVENSLLIKLVRRTDQDFAMPPEEENALSVAKVADLEAWIEMGAPDPRSGAKALTAFEQLMKTGQTHWAFQPVANPEPPQNIESDRIESEIDAFIFRKLAAREMTFASPATKRELLRRAYFDLIGLPPTMQQVAAFEADKSSEAFADVVDALLASPHYGERWGRHWLDVARYADTAGREGNGRTYYHQAHTYRDYVIRAFNEDLPFDRFIVEQLAADHLELPENDNRALAALGFLTVGRKMNGAIDDNARDDMIDTTMRGFLGLTAACARCHDHKLEPISTRDYYSLYGIIRSSEESPTPPELKPQPKSPARADYLRRNLAARRAFIRALAFEAERILTEAHARVGDYLLAVHDADYQNYYAGEKQKQIVRRRSLQQAIFNSLAVFYKPQVEAHPELFQPWLELAALPAGEFPEQARSLCESYAANADGMIHPLVSRAFVGLEPQTMQDVAWTYNRIFAGIDIRWGDQLRGDLRRRCEPTSEELALPKTTYGYEKPFDLAIDRVLVTFRAGLIPENDPDHALLAWLTGDRNGFAMNGERFRRSKVLTRDVAQGLRRDLTTELDVVATHPGAPSRAMAMIDAKQPYESKVFIRGNANNLGADAPRQFLEILSRTDQTPFPAETSGRLELARKIADPKNPLTARVIVNRVWMWHFGEGLVRTPSDFGMQGEKPTHPELLDYLASRFVREGWSLKKLHRWLMLSTTYQQSSRPINVDQNVAAQTNVGQQTDPENRLWHRMNPSRLEFEPFRDSLLAVSQRLNLEHRGGKPIDITAPGAPPIRTVYGEVDRKTLPNLFATFDFPDPMATTGQRLRNALTPESLFLLNSPFLTNVAKQISHQIIPIETPPALLTDPGFTGSWDHGADPRPQRLIAVEHAGQRYPALQGAVGVSSLETPQLFGAKRDGLPLNLTDAISGLDVTSGALNLRQIDVALAAPLRQDSDDAAGLFLVQTNGAGAPNRAVTVLPLDENDRPIGHWMLTLDGERFGSPLGKVQETNSHFTPRIATFTLADFLNLGTAETAALQRRRRELEGLQNVAMPAQRGYLSDRAESRDEQKWVQVELTPGAPLARVRLVPTFHYSKGAMFPTRYRVEIADDAGFRNQVRTLADFTTQDVPNPGLTPVVIDARGETGRCLRITVTNLEPGKSFSLAEVLAIDTDGQNRARGGVVVAKDNIRGGGFTNEYLTDGSFVRDITPVETKELESLRIKIAEKIAAIPKESLNGVHGLRLVDDIGSVDFRLAATGTFSLKRPELVWVDDDFRFLKHGDSAGDGLAGIDAFGTLAEALRVLDPDRPATVILNPGVYPEQLDLTERQYPITIRATGEAFVRAISGPAKIDGPLLTIAKLSPETFADRVRRFSIRRLYQRILQRDPVEGEIRNALGFLATYPQSDRIHPETEAWSYGMGTSELSNVEPGTAVPSTVGSSEVTDFKPLPFQGSRVRGPDSLELTATGGRPSSKAAAIRRWTAPYDGTIDIRGELSHLPANPQGDGVDCLVIFNSHQQLGTWTAIGQSLMTRLEGISVKQGDTLDFLTLSRADSRNDDFQWAPSITMTDRDIPAIPGIPMRWDAQTDFANPDSVPGPLGPWEELTQVLLLTNEFALVD